MTLEYILTKNGINPKTDLTIDTSVAFASMQGAFIGGTGDFVSLFEPNATSVEKNGFGYVVAELSKYIIFITYFPTQNRSKILAVISSLTVAPVTSPMASMACSMSISTASGVTPVFMLCIALSIASYARRIASN